MRFTTIVDAVVGYAKISTAHGFRRFGWAQQLWAKIAWILIFLIGFTSFVVLLVLLIVDYYSFAVKTVVDTASGNPYFPSVTVCNLNPIRRSKLSAPEVANLNKTSQAGSAAMSRMAKLIADTTKQTDNGHTINGMILYCSYDGKICDAPKHFVPYRSSRYGQCYTFNSNKNKRKTAVQIGPSFGLTVILNSERLEHLAGVAESDGFRVSVHAPGSDPYPAIQGFSVPTGMEILVGIREKERGRLDQPYGYCDDSTEQSGFLKSTLSCEAYCASSEDGCSCYPPCQETEYDLGFSLTKWPNKKHEQTLIDMLRTKHRQDMDDLSILKVYFKDFTKTILSQEPAYSLARFVTQIGGLSALCIGMSVLTLFEAFDLAASMAIVPRDDASLDSARPLSPTEDGGGNNFPPAVSQAPESVRPPVVDDGTSVTDAR